MPPFISDRASQGYLGRLFPHQYPELELPDRISDWSKQRILLLEAFGRLIHNNDRHFGNLSFFWQPGESELKLRLTPIYDMLPMRLAPAANGMVSDAPLEAVVPRSELIEVRDQAVALAEQFWRLAPVSLPRPRSLWMTGLE